MKIMSTYSVKIKQYNNIFRETISLYRNAVDYFIDICLLEWNSISTLQGGHCRMNCIEQLCHKTKDNGNFKYPAFDKKFYKFPSYLRRGAITEAIGKVESYKSNLERWKSSDVKMKGKKPSKPKAGYVYPCLYRDGMYEKTGDYEAKIKVFVRNTWDWITVQLKKSDVDYITRRSANGKVCAPTLQKRGKELFLDYPIEDKVELSNTDILNQTIVSVDLGINTAATISVMKSDGTILGRYFCKLPKEIDSLNHAINRIKNAQQNGNNKTPRLRAKTKGINHDISCKTSAYIIDIAEKHKADVIVFEHLDRNGKIHGSKKQKIHLWRSQEVQSITTTRAHRLGMRVSHICAWGTSKLAYDGSGFISRGKLGGFKTNELCRFKNNKVYNCDLSASYNIGSRYFIREILKSLPARERLELEAKVPQVTKRTTCTLSTLINLNAELIALAA